MVLTILVSSGSLAIWAFRGSIKRSYPPSRAVIVTPIYDIPPQLETVHMDHTPSHRNLNEVQVLRVDPVRCTLIRRMRTTDLDLDLHEVRTTSALISVHPGDTSINGTTLVTKDARVTLCLTSIHPKTLPVHPVYTLVIDTPPLLTMTSQVLALMIPRTLTDHASLRAVIFSKGCTSILRSFPLPPISAGPSVSGLKF